MNASIANPECDARQIGLECIGSTGGRDEGHNRNQRDNYRSKDNQNPCDRIQRICITLA